MQCDALKDAADGINIIREFEQTYNWVAMLGQYIGETMLLEHERLHADSFKWTVWVSSGSFRGKIG